MKLHLGKLDLQIVRELSLNGPASICALSIALKRSKSRISKSATYLESEGFIRKEGSRRVMKLHLSNYTYTQALKNLISQYPHIDFSRLLAGSALKILLPLICMEKMSISEISQTAKRSRISVVRVFSKLREAGIVAGDGKNMYRINSLFNHLSEFLREFQYANNLAIAADFSPAASMPWHQCDEFLVRTHEEIKKEGFIPTCYEAMSNYGIPLMLTGDRYYFYAPGGKTFGIEDIALHTLLLEQTPRNIMYVLLLLGKNINNVDWRYLKNESGKYQMNGIVSALRQFIENHGAGRPGNFPSWDEYAAKAQEYGI